METVVEEPVDAPPPKPAPEEQKEAWWKDAKIWINLVGYIAGKPAIAVMTPIYGSISWAILQVSQLLLS